MFLNFTLFIKVCNLVCFICIIKFFIFNLVYDFINKLNNEYKNVFNYDTVVPRNVPREKRLEEIRKTLNHEENKYAYERFVELYECECDGVVSDFTDTRALSHMRIIDADILTVLTAKAFQYALTKDELYGYEAVAGILSYLKTSIGLMI